MNLWFRLTLVCCVLVCLSMLLSLTQEVGLNQLLPIVASGPWLDVGREPLLSEARNSIRLALDLWSR